MALPLYVPFGYITFLFGLLWLFSRHYRARALRKKPPAPWFPEPHTARNVYVSLLSMEPPPPQPVLVAALLARAIADVKRIWALRDAKLALTALVQRGQVGDDLWEQLVIAEKELEAEIVEVVAEANEYAQGWGQVIFTIANEAATAQKSRDLYKSIPQEREKQAARLEGSAFVGSVPGQLSILNSRPAVPARFLAEQASDQVVDTTTPTSPPPSHQHPHPHEQAPQSPPSSLLPSVSSKSVAGPPSSTNSHSEDSGDEGSVMSGSVSGNPSTTPKKPRKRKPKKKVKA